MTGPTATIEDLSRIKYELESFLLGGQFDLYEDGRLTSQIEPENCAAAVSYGKLILSIWGEGWSRSWRALSCEVAPEELRLRCAKQMGRVECVIVMRRGVLSNETEQSRGEFAKSIAAMIESLMPGLLVERAVRARDDRHHFSGLHARLVIKDRNRLMAAIAVDNRQSQAEVDAALGAGIIWLDALRQKSPSINRLMIFAPRDRATTISTRLTAIEVPGASVSLFEVDEQEGSIEPVAPFDQGDLSDRLRRALMRADWPRTVSLASDAATLANSVVLLAPDLIETAQKGSCLAFSIHGLEFAQALTNRGQIKFGIGEDKKTLTAGNQFELERLVREISSIRTESCENRNDPLFRAQSERWLEAILRRDIKQIDATLDPRFAYSQVPAYRGEHRSFIDLLAITRAGRLVVIELKVSEDAEFPFQGLDYWLRVEWHRLRGDFKRRGYFEGATIADQCALIYLVAPLFRFHATTGLIAGSISSRVPVFRIGINEDWRAGVRVLLSERINPEK